ncbi:MAG TPA: c-type cytochrome [Longimicrobiales bacterium]|nr:c-type cytochrome [Longimicrobiales bacterium]
MRSPAPLTAALGLAILALACDDDAFEPGDDEPEPLDPELVAEGKDIFRYEDFGDWRFWTDTLRLHELVQNVDPATALSLGLKVDADAVPQEVLDAVLADASLLEDPAVTRQLLSIDAVVGVKATVENDVITRIGITCALCHSSVDDRVAPGIGSRVDGQPNHDLAVGTIVSLTPGLPDDLRPVYSSWPAGFFDPRFNVDGISDPVVIPPAYGLNGVELETFTGEGPISCWNNYVAVLEMHGRGDFADSRLGIDVDVPDGEDEVTPRLEALREYQLSLEVPAPPPGFFDEAAAERGRALFEGDAGCATCHSGARLTDDDKLHAPSETGMDATWAERGTTGRYRTTPLRGLWQHAPYFHDGSAATLEEVVEHYDEVLGLGLGDAEKADLVQYLRSL